MSPSWNSWRKEIIRGAALFCAVLAVGFAVYYGVHRVREDLVQHLPAALRDLRGSFDVDLHAGPRKTADSWTYHAKIAPKQWVWIHNTNGSVSVEPATGDSLQVTAVKTYRASNPAAVRVIAAPYDGGVAICAVWSPSDTNCTSDEEFNLGSARHSDVAVDFLVRLPANVRLGATTMNGRVHVTGASAPVVARTVSGDVDVETAQGPVSARTVNGDVHARMRAFGDTGAVSIFTINGTVTAELPARLSAHVEVRTVNGSIDSDYPLTASGTFTSHKLRGIIGSGGRELHITTVNGSIRVRKIM